MAPRRHTTLRDSTKLYLGADEAEALRLGRYLETAPVPLHDGVVAKHTVVMEAADVVNGAKSLVRCGRARNIGHLVR